MSETTNNESGKLVSAENTDSEIRSVNEISRVEINKQLEKIKQERENENFNRWVEEKVEYELRRRSRVSCYYVDFRNSAEISLEERMANERKSIRNRIIQERKNLETNIKKLLKPYEQKVARLIYGLDPDGYQERSYAEVAKILGINERLVIKFYQRIDRKLHPRYNSSNQEQEVVNPQDEKKYAKLTPFEKRYMLAYENDKSFHKEDVGRLYGIRNDVHTLFFKIMEKLREGSEDYNESIGKWYQERVIVKRLTTKEQSIINSVIGSIHIYGSNITLEELYHFLQKENREGIYYDYRQSMRHYGIKDMKKIKAKLSRLLNGITGTELDDVKN